MITFLNGERIRVDGEEGYREIWLARPASRNAIDVVMRDELYESLLDVATDPSVSVVNLCGVGSDFCAGGDLYEFGTRPDPARAWQIRLIRSLPVLFGLVAPRLAVGIQGSAVGAGVELAAFAPYIVATEDARFRLPEPRMGLIPGSGGTVSIPRRIGRRRTFEMALTNRWILAAEALEWGLVDELVPTTASMLHVLRERRGQS